MQRRVIIAIAGSVISFKLISINIEKVIRKTKNVYLGKEFQIINENLSLVLKKCLLMKNAINIFYNRWSDK